MAGLNAGVAPFLQAQGAAPNFLFLLALAFALDKENYDCFFIALMAGLFMDALAGLPPGSFSLPLLLMVFLASAAARQFLVMDASLKFLGLFLLPAQLVFNVGFVAVNFGLFKIGMTSDFIGWANFWRQFASSFLLNLVFIYPVYIAVVQLKIFIRKQILREYKAR
ncbi:MAG: hypothetical protein KGJ93_00845 [Patescibacteria group bacterium]|nr:hypothetical protein [Patescibacteria group bacterium]